MGFHRYLRINTGRIRQNALSFLEKKGKRRGEKTSFKKKKI
jgi:hypothetical protein